MCPRHHSGSHLVPTKGHTEDRVSREKLRTIDIADGWASLVAQMVKYSPAMQETRVRSLGWKDPLGEGNGYPTPVLLSGEFSEQSTLFVYLYVYFVFLYF